MLKVVRGKPFSMNGTFPNGSESRGLVECSIRELLGPSDVKATMIYNRTAQSITIIEERLSAGIWKSDCLFMAHGCVAGIVQILQELDEELTCRFVSE